MFTPPTSVSMNNPYSLKSLKKAKYNCNLGAVCTLIYSNRTMCSLWTKPKQNATLLPVFSHFSNKASSLFPSLLLKNHLPLLNWDFFMLNLRRIPVDQYLMAGICLEQLESLDLPCQI